MYRVLLEKLTVTQLVKKLHTIYGTRRFITAFTRIRHWPYPDKMHTIHNSPIYFPKIPSSIIFLSTPIYSA